MSTFEAEAQPPLDNSTVSRDSTVARDSTVKTLSRGRNSTVAAVKAMQDMKKEIDSEVNDAIKESDEAETQTLVGKEGIVDFKLKIEGEYYFFLSSYTNTYFFSAAKSKEDYELIALEMNERNLSLMITHKKLEREHNRLKKKQEISELKFQKELIQKQKEIDDGKTKLEGVMNASVDHSKDSGEKVKQLEAELVKI